MSYEAHITHSLTHHTYYFHRMYQDKLAHLKKQLQQLEDGTLPEFLKRKKKIEQQYKERLKMADIFKEYEVGAVCLCIKHQSFVTSPPYLWGRVGNS